MNPGTKHSDATRALISMKMRQVYSDPELRRRVAKRTAETWRDGTRPGRDDQLHRLNRAWAAAGRAARLKFLASCLAVAPAPHARRGRRDE